MKNTTLVAIGYWNSESNPDLPNPFWFIDKNSPYNEKEQVVKYLKKGKPVLYSRGISICRICGEPTPGSADLTDGFFVFPSGLVHYVEKHSLQLPSRFIDRIKSGNVNNWEEKKVMEKISNESFSFDWWMSQTGLNKKSRMKI